MFSRPSLIARGAAAFALAATVGLATPAFSGAKDKVFFEKVAGQWNMVGILDAYPFAEDQAESQLMTGMEMVRVGMLGENISKVAPQMAMPIRQALGRPLLSYGMTPLVIYRKVSG